MRLTTKKLSSFVLYSPNSTNLDISIIRTSMINEFFDSKQFQPTTKERDMKRLLKFIAALAVLLSSGLVHSETKREASDRIHGINRAQTATSGSLSYPSGPNRNKEYPASILVYAQPFMPKDTKVGVGWMTGKACDQNGNFVDQASAVCKIFVSHSAGKTYIFRQSEQEGDRYFVRHGSTQELYVHFNGGRYANTIAYQSPAAQQFASASGSQTVPVVASNGAAQPAQRTVNCKDSNISIGDRIACASGKVNNGATVAGAKPATPNPTVAQAPDCSQGTFLEMKLCKAQAGISGAVTGLGTVKP